MSIRLRSATLVGLLLLGFFSWRMVRPLNIFTVDDLFAWPIATPIPKGLTSLRASECGKCHQEIYREWSTTIHAQAWTEDYFVTDRAFEGNPMVCDHCHTQLERQRPYRIMDYQDSDRLHPNTVPNADYDPELQKEGVTCAVCHVRDGVILARHDVENAPHPVRVDVPFLSGMSPCRICHTAGGQRWDMFYRLPPCGTEAEIRQGGEEPDCVSCHLPRVIRPVVSGGKAREGGRHLFQGGHSPEKVKSALDGEVSLEAGEVVFRLQNSGTDHALPTGTPDRHLTVHYRLFGENGEILHQEQEILRRWILWRPFIVDLSDTRLKPGETREFRFPVQKVGARAAEVTVHYHLLDEARRKRIGWENKEPIDYQVYKQRIPLIGE